MVFDIVLVGEFKYPGGTRDPTDSSLYATAYRELAEEFLLDIAIDDVRMHLFNLKTTKVIQNRSFFMHNFVAVESENPWLQALDVDGINTQLRERRERFAKKLEDGTFWGLEMKEKEELAPCTRGTRLPAY